MLGDFFISNSKSVLPEAVNGLGRLPVIVIVRVPTSEGLIEYIASSLLSESRVIN